ncbi:MAG: serine/threonine protein kinase [Candidatus Xenobia bacterium]
MSTTARLAPGTVLEGRYEIVELLGEGGMGAVYRAADERLAHKAWAIKEVAPEPSDGVDTGALLAAEAHLLAGLEHPNLPRVVDHFQAQGRCYLVMELVDGETLEAIVGKRGALPQDEVLKLAWQLCDTLQYLHGRTPAVIFRDLKPGNVMVTSSGQVKLIDFGIARLFTAGRPSDTLALGTVGFAAPEQYGKRQSDVRTDLYGLAATLRYALTGDDPQDQPFNLAPVPEKALQPVLDKAQAMEPEYRHASVIEFRQALQAAVAKPASAPPPGPPPAPAPPKPAPPTTVLKEPWWQRLKPKPVAPTPLVVSAGAMNFGLMDRSTTRALPLTVQGRKAKVRTDRIWMRTRRLSATDWEVEALPMRLPRAGLHQGNVIVSAGRDVKTIPVRLELRPENTGPLLTVGALALTGLTLIPVVGLLAFIWLAALYAARPPEVRRDLWGFFYVSIWLSVLNVVGSGVLWVMFHHLVTRV